MLTMRPHTRDVWRAVHALGTVLQDSIAIGGASGSRFSAIRFSVTGAASPQPLQISALLRRAADRKTLWIRALWMYT